MFILKKTKMKQCTDRCTATGLSVRKACPTASAVGWDSSLFSQQVLVSLPSASLVYGGMLRTKDFSVHKTNWAPFSLQINLSRRDRFARAESDSSVQSWSSAWSISQFALSVFSSCFGNIWALEMTTGRFQNHVRQATCNRTNPQQDHVFFKVKVYICPL